MNDVPTGVWAPLQEGHNLVEGLEVIARLPASTPSRPPILFVHGATEGAWMFDRHWMPAAAEQGWPCYAVSLHGHGGSAPWPGRLPATIGDYVEDVRQVIVRLPAPPVLVGHSMGGLVVERLLPRHRTPAAVLVATPGLRHGWQTGWGVARRHPLDYLGGLVGRPVPARPEYQFNLDEMDRAEAERLLAPSVPESPMAQVQIHLPRRLPERGEAPVLVLGAGEDALISVQEVVRTARYYGTRAHVFRGMGHALPLERCWRQPLQVMLDWLDGVAIRPATVAGAAA